MHSDPSQERKPLEHRIGENPASHIVLQPHDRACNGSNLTRILEFKVLILPDRVKGVTDGGVILPEVAQDAAGRACTRGVIVAMAPGAFNYYPYAEDYKPKVGDRVLYGKYVGMEIKGEHTADGRAYQLVNDKDVLAVIDIDSDVKA